MPTRVLGGRYMVQDKIGTGGMAIVYRGLDRVLGRTVAIKTMLPQYAADPSFAARFKQEAQAAAALQSPYIVSVYDWGKDNDTYYIIMEYLRGTDLKSGIRKHGALDCRKVAQIGSQIAQALGVAHRHDIIHRDIKPQNIMVQPDGNIKVMDFGIARAKNSHLTADNSVLGTAHYVSPEQTQGKELGPTTDIYSLGIVMYEAATGRVPFDGDDAISVALKQVNEQPKPPSQINPRVDAALESIILKCMQKNPHDRFQTADALYHVLRDYLAGRLQAVNNATAVIPSINAAVPMNNGSGRRVTQRMNQQGGRMAPVQTSAPEVVRYNPNNTTATQQSEQRKRKHNTVVGTIVAILAVAAAAFAIWTFISQTATHKVPNYVGLTQDEAQTQIQQTNYFKVGNVKQEYNDNAPKGQVVDQTPNADKDAPSGTAIDLVVSKGKAPAEKVKVPDLTGMSPSDATTALAKVGLIGQAGDSIFSSTVKNGKIAAQNPKGGATAKAGDTITYQLSKGVETVDVPNVIGMSEDDATTKLENAGFSVVTKNSASDDYAEGKVSYQSVSGTATKGSEVDITVSTGPSTVTVPDVVGKTQAEAISILQGAGFNTSTNSDSHTNAPAGTVTDQSVSGSAPKGTTVNIAISNGAAAAAAQNAANASSNGESQSGQGGAGSNGGTAQQGGGNVGNGAGQNNGTGATGTSN